MRIREVLGALFTDEDFAAAFPDRGRPAISPGALALVSVLQYAEGLPDQQAADQVRAHMDWNPGQLRPSLPTSGPSAEQAAEPAGFLPVDLYTDLVRLGLCRLRPCTRG
ncbi:transposase [Streptomyces mirabilis]|uniref:transposase n=1 Tax=Streptomyces mirabilis TaxID=68239 RepID=UPI0036937CDF